MSQLLPKETRLPLFLYNLFFPFVLLAMLPNFILRMVRRGKYRHKFGQRFGIYSDRVRQRMQGKRWVWVHAVSVGEVLIALKFIHKWKQSNPALHVALSTTTSTGYALAKKSAEDWMEVIYNPLDFSIFVKRALDLVNPTHLILVEAEVWPNLVSHAKRRGAKLMLINARLSPRSGARFQKFRWLVGPIFRLLDAICVQETEEMDRWNALGVDREKLHCTGSIKFDEADRSELDEEKYRAVLGHLGVVPARPILLAGSTHSGEEKIIAQIYKNLRQRYPDLFLIIVPRHVERASGIVEELQKLALNVVRRTKAAEGVSQTPDVLLVDTTGELRGWYHFGTVIFIGKSITAHGGQNPVEAVMAGKPVVFGPHMENFKAVVRDFLARDAAVQVEDEQGLENAVSTLLGDERRRDTLSHHAREALQRHQGATGRTVNLL